MSSPAPQAWFSVLTEGTGAAMGCQGQSSPLCLGADWVEVLVALLTRLAAGGRETVGCSWRVGGEAGGRLGST